MKKILYFSFLLISFTTFSQNENTSVSGTTQEEYNYLTKGYKDQIEKGLDMKKGYILKNVDEDFSNTLTTVENNIRKPITRKNEFKLLFRENEELPCAILMITVRVDNNVKQYFCLPSHKSSLWNDFYKEFTASLNSELINMNAIEQEYLKAKYAYYFNSLKMISYCLTTNNLK